MIFCCNTKTFRNIVTIYVAIFPRIFISEFGDLSGDDWKDPSNVAASHNNQFSIFEKNESTVKEKYYYLTFASPGDEESILSG